jgi:hypothetical protein
MSTCQLKLVRGHTDSSLRRILTTRAMLHVKCIEATVGNPRILAVKPDR